MVVAAVRLQAVQRRDIVASGFFDREDQQSAISQGVSSGNRNVLECTELHERVGRHDHVELVTVILQVRGQFRLTSSS